MQNISADPMNTPYQPQDNNAERYNISDALDMLDERNFGNENHETSYSTPDPPKYEDAIRVRPQQPNQAATFESAPPSLPSLVAKMPPLLDLLGEPPLQSQHQPPPPYPILSPPTSVSVENMASPPASQISTDDAEDRDSDLPMSPMSPTVTKSGPIRGSSSNIHLWQFVKVSEKAPKIP